MIRLVSSLIRSLRGCCSRWRVIIEGSSYRFVRLMLMKGSLGNRIVES